MATEVQEQQAFDHEFDSVTFTEPTDLIEAITGLKPRLETEFDLTRIDPDERVQVRLDKNNAPLEMVKRFAAQMGFSIFPPIVVTEDGQMIDGNTRYRARYRIREEYHAPALVVPIKWETANEEVKTKLRYLGLALNNSNGKALDKVERRKMVRDALLIGMDGRQVSVTTGFEERVVRAIRYELEAEAKLERVGLKQPGEAASVREASLRALGRQADKINDGPFREIAKLAEDAGFAAGEITALSASVRETGSDESGLERIEREREANKQRIADRQHGGNGHPPAARQLKQRLGYINGKDAVALVETNRERMDEHLTAITAGIAKLQEVAKLQVETIESVSE